MDFFQKCFLIRVKLIHIVIDDGLCGSGCESIIVTHRHKFSLVVGNRFFFSQTSEFFLQRFFFLFLFFFCLFFGSLLFLQFAFTFCRFGTAFVECLFEFIHFLFQIAETEEQILFQEQRLASLKAWRSILIEGAHVLEHRDTSVRTRYIEEQPYYSFRHRPQSDEERTEAFLETSYLIRSRTEGRSMMEAVGTFHVLYDSFEKRLDGSIEDITLLQTVFPEAPERDDTLRYGGFTAVTCYHIGPMGNIRETYERMLNWAAEHQLPLQGSCMERQVLDTYSVVSPEKYVTEILLPIAGDPCGKER